MSSLATSVHVVHLSVCPDIGPVCQERDELPHVHDQRFTVGELRVSVEHALSEVLGVEVQVPLRLTRSDVLITRVDGTLVEGLEARLHHRNETLAGPGDPWVLGRAGWRLGELLLVGRAGLTVPLGSTVENPFRLGAAGVEHQHVQFGTGTVQPLLGLEVARAWGGWQGRAWGLAQLSLVDNRYGYQAGHRLSAGLAAEGPLVGTLRFSAGAEVVDEQPERWEGVIQQDGNLGRTDVLAGAGLSLGLGSVRVDLSVRVPVYQHLVGDHGQLTYPGLLRLGVSTLLGGPAR